LFLDPNHGALCFESCGQLVHPSFAFPRRGNPHPKAATHSLVFLRERVGHEQRQRRSDHAVDWLGARTVRHQQRQAQQYHRQQLQWAPGMVPPPPLWPNTAAEEESASKKKKAKGNKHRSKSVRGGPTSQTMQSKPSCNSTTERRSGTASPTLRQRSSPGQQLSASGFQGVQMATICLHHRT
jgi:hypothetical protein